MQGQGLEKEGQTDHGLKPRQAPVGPLQYGTEDCWLLFRVL